MGGWASENILPKRIQEAVGIQYRAFRFKGNRVSRKTLRISVRSNSESTPFFESSKKEKFVSTFSEYINRYMPQDELGKELLHTCHGENSPRINEKVVSHFPLRVYNGLEDLAKTITNPANCHSYRVTIPVKENSDFGTPEPVYVYTDIIKPHLV
jgi:hypothetical protein